MTEMREGVPVKDGTLRVWRQIGRGTGAREISLRVLEFASGVSPGLRNESCDEILYVMEGGNEQAMSRKGAKQQRNTIFIDGWRFEVKPQTGIYLRPGQTLTV